MKKYDHIIKLTGLDIYPAWRRTVELALASEGICNHCSNGTDPDDVIEFASVMPKIATPGQPTSTELSSIKEWVHVEDSQRWKSPFRTQKLSGCSYMGYLKPPSGSKSYSWVIQGSLILHFCQVHHSPTSLVRRCCNSIR